MIRRPPRSTRTDTLFPYTTLFRSTVANARGLEFLVLSGSLTIDHEALEPQSGRRLPAGTALDATVGPEGTRLWIRIAPAIQYARSEEHTSELQSLMRISYAVFCLKKKKQTKPQAKARKDKQI